jgi:uncharacterized protein YqeY
MTLKEKIQQDFISAMKAKDDNAKAALSSIKASITILEKADGLVDACDDDVIKLINKAIKQREESQKIYEDAGRDDMAKKEADEACVLRAYMPAQMTPQEIGDALIEIMKGFAGVITNPQALQGKTIGEFNKRFQGRADIGTVKNIVAQLIES